MDATFDAIRDGLERLRTAKRPPKGFGAESHGFKLNPPLSESAIRKFEAKHRIALRSNGSYLPCASKGIWGAA